MRRIVWWILKRLEGIAALYYGLLVRVVGFWHVSVRVGHIHDPWGSLVRFAFYKRMLTSVGNGVYFAYGCNLSYPEVSIGEDVRIGYGTNVGLVDIGRDVRIGANCNLLPFTGKNMYFLGLNSLGDIFESLTLLAFVAAGAWKRTGSEQ